VRFVSAAVAVALAGIPGGGSSEQRVTAAGLSMQVPSGWHVIDRKLTPCVDPSERIAVASSPVEGGRLPEDGALVVLMERIDRASVRAELQRVSRRPASFRPRGQASPLECCSAVRGPGWLYSFAEGGRTFYAYVFAGRKADEQTRREAFRALDTLGVEPRTRPLRWRRSTTRGLWYGGSLSGGVQLPQEGKHYFTWDPIRKRSPNRLTRLWGTDRLLRTVLRVVDDYAAANPDAPRVAIGDISRRNGGDFGPRFGWPGHVSHQIGLDVDVYYPRLDREERAPRRVSQVDLRLSQDLVDRFVAAGAIKVFVGPNTPLRGPRGVVEALPRHDNHIHVRLPLRVSTRTVIGRSVRGRPIVAYRLGTARLARRVLVFGTIHGDEPEGLKVTRRLISGARRHGASLWVVPTLNPDGRRAGTRNNARGVDLNRNFPSEWEPLETSGPRALSEPETRAAARLIRRLRPAVTIWFHQPQRLVRAWGRSTGIARRYAQLAGARYGDLRWPPGSAPNWQNQRLRARSFVVELRPGRLPAESVKRHAQAVLALARDP
jgi:murein peptide amidase A